MNAQAHLTALLEAFEEGSSASVVVTTTADGDELRLSDLEVIGYQRGVQMKNPDADEPAFHAVHVFTLSSGDLRLQFSLWGEPI